MQLILLKETFSICKLPPQASWSIPSTQGALFSLTKTNDEISVVCEKNQEPPHSDVNTDWRAFRVVGTLDFALTGILSSMTLPLAEAEISIFAISTFDTDYLLVKASACEKAINTLEKAGFTCTAMDARHPSVRITD